MATNSKTFLMPEQYLEIESKAEFKSEYYNGEMFAMAGAGRAHILICGNASDQLRRRLREGPCEVYQSDMRVKVNATGLYTYLDAVVACTPQFLDDQEDTLLNPTLIVEVLSPSTEAYDRGRKFEHYRSVESLTAYLLVSSDRIHVDLFTRQPEGRWLLASTDRLEDAIELQSIGCRVAVADLYERVEFGEEGREPAASDRKPELSSGR